MLSRSKSLAEVRRSLGKSKKIVNRMGLGRWIQLGKYPVLIEIASLFIISSNNSGNSNNNRIIKYLMFWILDRKYERTQYERNIEISEYWEREVSLYYLILNMTSSRHPYTYENFMQMLKNTRIERPKILRKTDKQVSESNLKKQSIVDTDCNKFFDEFDSYVVVKFESI